MPATSSLVVLGCSATKTDVAGDLPAIHRYDGPFYRVFRSHLREYEWSQNLSVSILSARYGLIGGLAQISTYEQRMTKERAHELKAPVNSALEQLATSHKDIHFLLGKDYLSAINLQQIGKTARL